MQAEFDAWRGIQGPHRLQHRQAGHGHPLARSFPASPGKVHCAISQLASSPLQPLSAVLQYLPELQRAAALLAFQAGTQCAPYKQLFDDARVRRGLW